MKIDTAIQKVFFRADAGLQIGYGHFIRTLALADMLRDDFDCTFFTQSPSEYQQREAEKVCPLVALPSDDNKFEKFLDYLSGEEIVVLDNYFFTTEYQQQIREKGCKLVCLDGMTTKHYVSDILINQSLDVSRPDFSLEEYTIFNTGLQYALLRKPFLNKSIQPKREINPPFNIVICFGGADMYNLTDKVISQLNEEKKVGNITTIVGDAYHCSLSHQNVCYRRNLSAEEMADVIFKSDIAILPSSTVLKEALACKIYIISGYFVDNQIQTYNAYLDNNLICGVGDFTVPVAMKKLSEIINTGVFYSTKPENCKIDGLIPQRYINMFKNLSICK